MNKYKIGIIIPFYQEKFSMIKPNIDMLNNQLGINRDDVKVYFVNDGVDNEAIEKELNDECCLRFDYEFYYMDDNEGPGVCRQYGIDISKDCEYLLFIDSDDMISSPITIRAYLDNIKVNNKPDVIVSKFIEEIFVDDKMVYLNHDYDWTWMFAKCYKRSFLEYYNIRFHKDLRIHEDSYFNSIVAARTNNIVYLDMFNYIWKYNDNTITRSNNGLYTYSGVATFFDSIRLSFEEIEKFNKDALYSKVVQIVYYGYYDLIKPEWNDDKLKEYHKAGLKSYAKLIKQFSSYFDVVDLESKRAIKLQEYQRFRVAEESMTFEQFIKSLNLEEVSNE